MTSESTLDEERKRHNERVKYIQRNKRRIGWTLAAALALTLLGVVNPAGAKISCDDPSIRMPYSGDTITVTMLIVVTLIVPFFVMTIVEWAVPPSGQVSPPLREGLSRSWSYTGDIFVGGLFMFFLNDLAKTTVSEPRPHFWDTCRPNITEEQCRQPYVILSWRDCTNPLKQSHPRLIDSMKSFPSGHASLSVFSSIFMMVYIKQRIWGRSSRLLAPWIQLLWAVWTLYCCQSRIADNRHHWWDVLAGGLLGAFASFLTVHYFSNWFKREDDLGLPGDPGYHRQEERASRYSRTSIKRLISSNSDMDNHNDHRLGDRELRDINGTP
ncbi:phospholipid phosphatase 2-like isoform X1 [Penaeus japonicus]|uniref:phospholipid phosphatase 2-like isoform X1 n=1 Tax=Penaeus japonicus TaxID=27405 RepID=UPI001C70B035|nr:phospholipid phosphatase 2-like isoform X1 [Penaeus japonicus]